jgi:hypothetical protein
MGTTAALADDSDSDVVTALAKTGTAEVCTSQEWTAWAQVDINKAIGRPSFQGEYYFSSSDWQRRAKRDHLRIGCHRTLTHAAAGLAAKDSGLCRGAPRKTAPRNRQALRHRRETVHWRTRNRTLADCAHRLSPI